MLRCPQCRWPLERVKTAKGQLHVCLGCEGRALNLAVLRKLVPTDVVKLLWQQVLLARERQLRPCPGCGHPMHEAELPLSKHTVALEVCRRCQMLWCDGGELERLPLQPPAGKTRLSQKAREAIALWELERDRRRHPEEFEEAETVVWLDVALTAIFLLLRLPVKP